MNLDKCFNFFNFILVIEELQQLGGIPIEQVLNWDSSPDLTTTIPGPVYFGTGPNPVTETLDVIIEHEITNVQSNQGPQIGRQNEIELQNAEVHMPKINLEFDEECNWFEKTCTGSKLIRQISLLMELGAKSFVSQYRK